MTDPRDPYAEVGAAMRQSIERATTAKCTPTERRVLDAVLALVASYSRLADRVSLAAIAKAAGVRGKRPELEVRKALRRLAEVGAVVYTPGSGRTLSLVGIPAGEGVPTLVSSGEGAPTLPPEGRDTLPPEGAPTLPPEKFSEKLSEESAGTWIDKLGITTLAVAS